MGVLFLFFCLIQFGKFYNLCNQDGKLSEEEAVAIAEKLGFAMGHHMGRTTSSSRVTQKLHNFSVYKWNKAKTVQRLILQVGSL